MVTLMTPANPYQHPRHPRVVAAEQAIAAVLAADPSAFAGLSAAEVYRRYTLTTRRPVHVDTFVALLKAQPQVWESLQHSNSGPVPRNRACVQCSRAISPRAARFCSRACWHDWQREQDRLARVARGDV